MELLSANITSMPKFAWKLPEVLEKEQITPYRLHKTVNELGTKATTNTIYKWSKELPSYVTIEHFTGIISALRELTGKEITANDLLEYDPDS